MGSGLEGLLALGLGGQSSSPNDLELVDMIWDVGELLFQGLPSFPRQHCHLSNLTFFIHWLP